MPSEKLVLTCDADGAELSCAGGYLNNDVNEAFIIYFCSECNTYYLSMNGSFLDGSWDIMEAEEAEEVQIQLRKGSIAEKKNRSKE